MAQQTNFVKITDSASLFSYMKYKTKLWPTPIDGVYIFEILFAKKKSKF